MAKHKRLKPIGDYLYDKGEMIEQMFSSIPIVEIRNMVPIKLQGMPLHELKAECLVELLGISDREISNILDGKKEKNVSSSDSEQGGFVISDEEEKLSEKRIKKEKKDTVRKIKTERTSSKKDGTSRNSEPSTSKKKRKSKEIVEVDSRKKKKSGYKAAHIPSSSRNTSEVPVGKKKKDKKDEKKKDSSKKKDEEDEIVVLDDDSDKEEKRGQKSLLDLLELEMRARAIRSLLKKEEAVQAQKILSEYKDEPDDLIPIDIEPPHIELLSDSEGEEITNAIDLEAQVNTSTEKMSEVISSKRTEDSLQSFEDQEQHSRSPQGGPTDDSNGVCSAIEKIAASDSRIKVINLNTSKSSNDGPTISDSSDPSPVDEIKDDERNDEVGIVSKATDHDDTIQSKVPSDIISVNEGELPGSLDTESQFSSVLKQCDSEGEETTKAMDVEAHENTSSEKTIVGISSKQPAISCDPLGTSVGSDCTQQDTGNIDSSQRLKENDCILSSAENLRNKIDTGHFLVIEEPSIVQAMDGSQTEEITIEANNSSARNMKPSSDLDSHQYENVDCLTVQEELQQPTVAESSQIDSNSDLSNGKNAVYNSGSSFDERSSEKGAGNLYVGDSDCSNTSGTNVTLHPPIERCESSYESSVEDKSHSHFEDEVLDYDYNPVDVYCEKERNTPIAPSENPPSFVADELMGKVTDDHRFSSILHPNSSDAKTSEENQNNPENISHQVSNDYGIAELEANCCTECPTNCDENVIHPSDFPLEETATNTCSLATCGDCTSENDSNQKSPSKFGIVSRNQLETSELKDDVRPCDSLSPESLKDSQPNTLVSVSIIETKDNESFQESDGSNEVDDRVSNAETDSKNSPENISTHEKERHRCWGIKPPVDVEILEQPGSPEQNQITTDQDLPLQLPGLNSRCSENIATTNTVTDDLLVLEGNIANVGKVETPQNRVLFAPSPAVCVPACLADLVQQTPLNYFERVEKTMISEPCLPSRTADDSDVLISTLTSKRAKAIPVDCNESPNTNDDFIEEGQNPESSSLISSVSCIVESLNSKSSQILEPLVLSTDLEILDEANDIQVSTSSGTNADTRGSDEIQPPCSQNLVDAIVAEVIDITDSTDVSEVVFVSEEIVDPDSIDESDNDISDNAALILEQMNNILNDDVCAVRASTSDGSCPSSPQATNIVAANVHAVDSGGSSEPVTDEENEDDGLPEGNTFVEVSDLDDASEKETKDEETSDTSVSESSHDSIELIDDSGSVCSIESQRDDSKSDDCIIVPQPQSSISDDCFIVTEPVILQSNDIILLSEPEGSESDDCTLKSQHNDATLDEPVIISDEEVPCVKATGSLSSENNFTTKDMDSVMVTIIIEDNEGDEEEVKLLTEDVPAEILELNDDDEAKTDWTARWLESDNVKKVVQTSKILTNVRKQMKMKLKKIETPVTNGLKLPEGKSAPPLIGSVEEYHRLVKEGVIFSKASQNDENTGSSNDAIKESVDPSKESAESKGQGGHDKKSDKETAGKEKKLGKSERKKKLKKSERRRKSDKYEKKKSDEFSSYPNEPELSLSPGEKKTDTYSKSNKKLEVLDAGKVVVEDTVREDGEIIESSNSELPDPKEGNEANGKIMSNVFDDRVCLTEQNTAKDGDVEEREEGETSDKEEGEISDSDDDRKEYPKSSQSKPSSSLKITSESKECNRNVSPLSSIPLPQKPPSKQLTNQQLTNNSKQQSSKTPDRNSAAKRFILRNLQLGRKRPANSKNKKKKKKKKKGAGQGNKKGLGYSPIAAPEKNNRSSKLQMKGTYENPISQTEVSLASASNLDQTVPGVQPSYMATYCGLPQPGSNTSQLGSAQITSANVSSTQLYDSYYSWAYSQGLISPANGNYGYGTPESIQDPNVYKQWEEYYRKLMEACKVSAEHASAGSLYASLAPTSEKSGYSWVFDHSTGASQTAQVEQTIADSTTEPVAQVQAPSISSETVEGSQSVPVTNEISDKDRFESWQYRYGLKGLLKEHFIPAPTAPSSGDGSQKS